MGKVREVILDSLTVAAVIGAIYVVAVTFRGGNRNALAADRPADQVIVEWDALKATGHSLGAVQPTVTLVEFGDYECPACRAFHRTLRAVMAQYPTEFAVIYRHWPLSMHRGAYPAARAAECAATQDVFPEFHDRLYSDSEWMINSRESFIRYATEAGIRDVPSFENCIASDEPVEAIERAIVAATELMAVGTPTVILDGVMLGVPPDSARLASLVAARLAEARSTRAKSK